MMKGIEVFIRDLIETLQRGDVDRFFRYFVPRFILLGLGLLALTFLGPLGILIAVVLIGAVIYFALVK